LHGSEHWDRAKKKRTRSTVISSERGALLCERAGDARHTGRTAGKSGQRGRERVWQRDGEGRRTRASRRQEEVYKKGGLI